MKNEKWNELRNGFETAYIDGEYASGDSFRPCFISNNYEKGVKVLSSIEDELLECDEFRISVAFITSGGVEPLLQTLRELNEKGVPGKILTTNYLTFCEPKALEKLHSLNNITVKMYDVEAAENGFHTKGYIFKKEEFYRIIIGSSNMTQTALASNKEWNTKIVSTENGEVAQQVLSEFDDLWNSQYALDYDKFIDTYRERYQIIKHQREIARQESPISLVKYRLEPNSMQVGFINNLKELISNGAKKALLISATGTGKTYAAAFAMRELGYKKVLFIAHRNQIVKQAKKSFENVFGNTIKTGYIAGIGDREDGFEADYVFATVASLNGKEGQNTRYKKFAQNHFDCCIYDESHHAPAESYRNILDYFTPSLTLGMTATPDRRDDKNEGYNVYEIFDHNIAYEIRLQKAMEENLLCPFHYFGISDLEVITDTGNSIEREQNFRYLICDERIRLISQQAEYYGHSGNRVKGLIFCSRNDEAKELSRKLNEYGYKTVALSGSDSENAREKAIELLTKEIDVSIGYKNNNGVTTYSGQDYLDYIISVDIFSEGADIVDINQIIMLRPTQSPIVFIQQLGRGLRKAYHKEYVVVLDFIANYRNNFMIPIALSGDRSYNKDNVRKYIMNGSKVIPGVSSIHFDSISRKRIYEALDRADFSEVNLLKENYYNLKDKLGRIPSLLDFDEYGEMDVLRIFDNKSIGSYYYFLVRYEPEYKIRLKDSESEIVKLVSTKIANGKRIHELELLRIILDAANTHSTIDIFKELKSTLKSQYGKTLSDIQKQNLINIFTYQFFPEKNRPKVAPPIIEKNTDGVIVPSKEFDKLLHNKEFYAIAHEIVDFGIARYLRDYSKSYKNTDLVLYQKYTYEDVCRLLNWDKNLSSVMNGYYYHEKTNTYPVFINYDKDSTITATTMYEDRFAGSNSEIIAISKSNRHIESPDVQLFIHSEELGIPVHMFIRKNKDDKISKEFYYLGQVFYNKYKNEFVMQNTTSSAVEIGWTFEVPVRNDLYKYFEEK